MNCPHCNQPLIGVTLKPVPGNVPFGPQQVPCLAISCGRVACAKLLSVQVDPLAMKQELLDELMRRLSRKP